MVDKVNNAKSRKLIRLKGMPEHLEMKVFSVAISPNRTDTKLKY